MFPYKSYQQDESFFGRHARSLDSMQTPEAEPVPLGSGEASTGELYFGSTCYCACAICYAEWVTWLDLTWCHTATATVCCLSVRPAVTFSYRDIGWNRLVTDCKMDDLEWPWVHGYAYFISNSVFTARCTIVQSAVLRSHVVCLSVCPSVTLVDQDHIGRKSWKLIAETLSPTPSLFGVQRPSTYSQGNMGKFWGDKRWGGKNGALEHKTGNISETRTDRGKVSMGSL